MSIVRMATFNVRHALGLDGRIDLRRTAETISSLGASVVGLQELDVGLPRSGRVDEPARLAELTGLWVSFFATVERRGGRYGLGLATAGPAESRLDRLPRVAGEEPRGVVVSRSEHGWVLVTHLAHGDAARSLQTRALAELVGLLDGPVVVLGDLNQGRRHLGPLIDAGLDPGPDRHATKPGRWRRKQIDFVLAGRGARVVRSWTVSSQASDHLPVVADIEVG